MDQLGDGVWRTTIEVTAAQPGELIKKAAAVARLLKKLDAEKPKPRRARGEGALFKRADGIWVGRVPDPTGEKQYAPPVYSKSQAECVAKMNKLREDLAKGRKPVPKRLTVEAYLTDWMANVAPGKVSPNALTGYRSTIRTRIIPAIGKKYLATLGPDDIRDLHKWVGSAKIKGTQKTYSSRSVEEAHNVLSGALDDAKGAGKIHDNPCGLVKKPSVVSQSHGSLTAADARKVLLSALECGDPMVTRWAAGLMLGGRQGEILGLQWDRVDLDKGTLDLAWQLDWLKLKKGAKSTDDDRFDVKPGYEHKPLWKGSALTRPKSSKSMRLIPIPAPLAAILTVYKEKAPPNPWGLVWVTPPEKTRYKTARPVSDVQDRKGWAAAQARAGIDKPVDVHAMRGTTATLLMEAGVDARIIQELLGHTSITTTRGYQTVDLSAARRSLGELAPLLQIT